MIRNYLTIALRSMLRNKAYSFINIFGLSVGIACCLMLALYIQDEASYDKHHRDVDNIYRVTSVMGENGEHVMRTTSPPIVWGIKDELPEIEAVTRLVNPPGASQNLIEYDDKKFYESDGYVADSTLFDIFDYEFREGNPKKALVEANSVVITDKLAKKIFGNESALNKVIRINQGGPAADFKVTGVLGELQKNSHINVNFFVSMTSSGWAEYMRSPQVTGQWAGQNFILSYVRLKPGHTAGEFIPKMNNIFLKYGAEDLKALGMKKTLGLEPVKDVYLYSSYGGSSPRITYLYVIASIAIFILLIACINFMNLSTAKAAKRASEVGLRKTMGAFRSSLIGQFLGEAMVIVIIAIVFSLGIVQVLLPVFNAMTGKDIAFSSGNLVFFFGALVMITVVTGVIAGSYPAFYLSSFQPAKVLKGNTSLHNSGSVLRKSLVVFQFVIAIVLGCGMLMIERQLDFMQNKDLGFDASNKLVIPLRTEDAKKNFEVFNQTISSLSSVKSSTASNYIPGGGIWNDFSLYPEGSSMEKAVMIKNVRIEPNFLEGMGISLVAGRTFTNQRESESQNKLILNEIAVRRLGFTPETIVGQTLYTDRSTGRAAYEIIGVMEDYHQLSVKDEIFPVMFHLAPDLNNHAYVVVNIKGENATSTITSIEQNWKEINPEIPFEYTFLDENIKRQYDDDKRVAAIISAFTVIAMIISCLGLYGLSTFMAERRTKEIGVRKVLGASLSQITTMMSTEFVRLVIIAFVIAVPLGLYAINSWLEHFAYKAPVDIGIFFGAGATALAIALFTVSFESIKAASANPVKALRNE